jgi:hypothetical protein
MGWSIYKSQGVPNFVRYFDIGIGKKLVKDIWPLLLMGNLIQLLGLGKKVYLNPETSQWNMCQNLGIKVYNINGDIDLNINAKELENNKKIVKEYFSSENLKKQLKIIFGGG